MSATETSQPAILYTADKLISAIDDAIKEQDAKAAANAAIKAAKHASKMGGETAFEIRAALRTRLDVNSDAPSVPGGSYGSYYRGKTAVYVKAFGTPTRFDLRIRHMLRIDEADGDRRSRRLAMGDAPPPGGMYAFMSDV